MGRHSERSEAALRRELAAAEMVVSQREWSWYKSQLEERLAESVVRLSARLSERDYQYECGIVKGLKVALGLPEETVSTIRHILGGEEHE